jgi:Tfp pilus assembly protein PilN
MSSPRSPDSRLAFLLIICTLVVLWLAFGTPLHGQTSISESLNESEQLLEQLVQRLQERLLQVQKLETDLKAISLSHEKLLQQYDLLDSNWKSYRAEVEQIIADDARRIDCLRWWNWALAGTTILGIIVSIVTIYN